MSSRFVLAAFLALTPSAFAQSFNVDFDGGWLPQNTAPSAAFGGVIQQPGVWNRVSPQDIGGGVEGVVPTFLVGLGGGATGVLLTVTNPQYSYVVHDYNLWESADWRALWNDWLEVEGGGQIKYQISGLTPGFYSLTNHVRQAKLGTPVCTVNVASSPDGVQSTFPSTTHLVWIASGGVLDVTITANPYWAACNGFQLTKITDVPTLNYCAGDGSNTPCPCANSGTFGRGCRNSFDANGAGLYAYGNASLSADTLVLDATSVSDSFATFFQGTTTANGGIGVVLGDGLLCTGGSLVRLGTNLAHQGHVTYPAGSDLPVSVRGGIAGPGVIGHYQLLYRDSFPFCTAATFNTTNAVKVGWSP